MAPMNAHPFRFSWPFTSNARRSVRRRVQARPSPARDGVGSSASLATSPVEPDLDTRGRVAEALQDVVDPDAIARDDQQVLGPDGGTDRPDGVDERVGEDTASEVRVEEPLEGRAVARATGDDDQRGTEPQRGERSATSRPAASSGVSSTAMSKRWRGPSASASSETPPRERCNPPRGEIRP